MKIKLIEDSTIYLVEGFLICFHYPQYNNFIDKRYNQIIYNQIKKHKPNLVLILDLMQ